MATNPNTFCPAGTWCISYTTGFALLVILILSLYIFVTRFVHTPITPSDTSSHSIANMNNHHRESSKTHHTNTPTPAPHPTVIVQPPSVSTRMYSTSSPHHGIDMLRPPVRQSPETTSIGIGLMPINIKTRGETPDMQQVGILRSNSNDKVLALYGRPTYKGSSKWIYYTGTDKYHSIKLPIEKNKRDCTSEYGCDELYDDDEVRVKGYNEIFQTSIYQLDAPRYIPFVA